MPRHLKSKLMTCKWCQQKVRVPPYRWSKFRFCTRSCLFQWHNKHDRVQKQCDICGKTFTVIRVREKTAKFCSLRCYNKVRHYGSVHVACVVCGKTVRRSPSKVKEGRTCCSPQCRCLLQRKRTPQPASSACAREWMTTRGRLTQCQRCGFDRVPEILVVHHRDRNRNNNHPDNLEVLCPNCHAIEHYAK